MKYGRPKSTVTEEYPNLGYALRDLLTAFDPQPTVKEMADATGVGRETIRAMVLGQKGGREDTLSPLAKFLGGDLESLLVAVQKDRVARQQAKLNAFIKSGSDPITDLVASLPDGLRLWPKLTIQQQQSVSMQMEAFAKLNESVGSHPSAATRSPAQKKPAASATKKRVVL